MKTPLIFFFLIGFLFTLGTTAKAQDNDYIITNKGDTLRGELNGRRFKAKRWAKAKKINLDTIKETYVADDDATKRAIYVKGKDRSKDIVYINSATDTPHTFMKVIESGKIDLYLTYDATPSIGVSYVNGFMPSAGAVSTPYYYVAKGADTLRRVAVTVALIAFKPSKKQMDVLGQLINDNKDVYDKFIADDKLSFREVRNIIHLYNTGKPFAEKPPKPVKVDSSNDFNPGQ